MLTLASILQEDPVCVACIVEVLAYHTMEPASVEASKVTWPWPQRDTEVLVTVGAEGVGDSFTGTVAELEHPFRVPVTE